jgi:hypothetical protein
MPDAETAAVLRTVLNEVCVDISPFDTAIRTRVAAHLLEKATQADISLEELREAASNALRRPPTMWR